MEVFGRIFFINSKIKKIKTHGCKEESGEEEDC